MEFDPVLLARIEFFFNVAFHILFPSFTIGLASWLAVLEGAHLATGREEYRELSRFWTKVFAVSFGMGVVSGIVMTFQFGMNWSVFSHRAGAVMGPLITYEVITAFFLEATFLGVMLFGRGRVPDWMHFVATCAVALGTMGSAFWILSANSWMQTPGGFEILADGTYRATDWGEVIITDSLPLRIAHMLLAAYLTTAFVVAGSGAWYLLKNHEPRLARRMLSMGLGLATILLPIQLVVGHLSGVEVGENQPMKMAAIEARWETQKEASLTLVGWPDQEAATTLWAIDLPKIGSFIDSGDWDATMPGLKEWPQEDWPPVVFAFWGFRIMFAVAMVMLVVVVWSVVLRVGGRIYTNRPFLILTALCTPAGWIAVLAGWVTTETGRQPWIVYEVLRVADAFSPLAGWEVPYSFLLYILVYTVIFGSGGYFVYRLLKAGPQPEEETASGSAKRPLGYSMKTPASAE